MTPLEDRIEALAMEAGAYLSERGRSWFPSTREAGPVAQYRRALSPDRIRALTRVVRAARALNDYEPQRADALDDSPLFDALDAALYDLDTLWKEEQK